MSTAKKFYFYTDVRHLRQLKLFLSISEGELDSIFKLSKRKSYIHSNHKLHFIGGCVPRVMITRLIIFMPLVE
jgi:hypothetical protein